MRKLVLGNGFTEASDLAGNPLFERQWVASARPQELLATWLNKVRAAPASPLRELQECMLAQRQSPENLQARFLGVTQAQAAPQLALKDRDIVVLDCDDDPLIHADARDRLRARYPGARHVRLPRGGHYPHLLNPEAYEGVLLDAAFA